MANFNIRKKPATKAIKEATVHRLDKDQIRSLALAGLSVEEIAMFFQVKPAIINADPQITSIIQEAYGHLISKLKGKQVAIALEGNVAMLKWLGTNLLGQSDKPTTSEQDDENFNNMFDDIEFLEYEDDGSPPILVEDEDDEEEENSEDDKEEEEDLEEDPDDLE